MWLQAAHFSVAFSLLCVCVLEKSQGKHIASIFIFTDMRCVYLFSFIHFSLAIFFTFAPKRGHNFGLKRFQRSLFYTLVVCALEIELRHLIVLITIKMKRQDHPSAALPIVSVESFTHPLASPYLSLAHVTLVIQPIYFPRGPLVLSRDPSSPAPSPQLLFSASSRMSSPFIHLLFFTFQTLRPQKMRPQNLRWKPRKVLGGTRTRLDGEELQVSLLNCIRNQ